MEKELVTSLMQLIILRKMATLLNMTIGGLNKMNVGTYEIFINDDATDNYSIAT